MSQKNTVVTTPQQVNNFTKQAALLGDIASFKSQIACTAQQYWRLMEEIHGLDSDEAIAAHSAFISARQVAVRAVNYQKHVQRESDKLVAEHTKRVSHELAEEIAAAAIGHAMRKPIK